MTRSAYRIASLAMMFLLAFLMHMPLLHAEENPYPAEWFSGDKEERAIQDALIGKPMPVFRVSNWINGPVKKEDLKGKIVVIDFWATWCGPCRKALPRTNELYEKYKDEDVVVMAVCSSSGQGSMPGIVKEKNLTMPVGRDRSKAMAKAWKVMWWPTFAVVGRDGNVVAVGVGSHRLEYIIEDLLASNDEAPNAAEDDPNVGKNPFPDEWFYRRGSKRAHYDAMIGRPMPDTLDVTKWENGEVKPEDLKDKVAVIKFWSTWCGHCIRSMDDTNALYEKYKDQGVVVFGICGSNNQSKMPAIIKEQNVIFPTGRDTKKRTSKAWNVNLWPTYFVIDRQGKVVAAGMKPEYVEDVLKEALTREKPEEKPAVKAVQITLPNEWLEGNAGERQRFKSIEGKPAPELKLRDWHNTDGEKLNLKKLQGKIVVLDFWATWCGPCINSIPHTNEMMEKYKDDGVVILGICNQRGGENMVDTKDKHNIQYPIAWDRLGAMADAYDVRSYPDYYIIGRDGTLIAADVNNHNVEDALDFILEAEKNEQSNE